MIPNSKFNFKRNINFNFEGGKLSSDSGIFLFHDFVDKIGFNNMVQKQLPSEGKSFFTEAKLFMQMVYLTILGYHNQSHNNDLRNDPAVTSCFEDSRLGSQSSVSRFVTGMDEKSLKSFEYINDNLLNLYYEAVKPEYLIFDIDTTNLAGFGNQEGLAYNTHYGEVGLSALMLFESETGLNIKNSLRSGATHCSNSASDFLKPVLKDYGQRFPNVCRLIRGDAGFSTPEVYRVCEENKANYLIKLKRNNILNQKAEEIASQVFGPMVFAEDRILVTEFQYKAAAWETERRVLVEIKRNAGEMCSHYTFLITNLKERRPSLLFDLYRKRGAMENHIKEAKNGFAITKISQKSLISNSCQLQMKMIAYNLTKIFSSLVLPDIMKKYQIETLRNKIFKIASKMVKSSGQYTFQMATSFPYKQEFQKIVSNIKVLKLSG